MVITQFGHISDDVAGYTSREMLDRGAQTAIFERFCDGKVMPKNKGQVMKWARMKSATPALAPVQEGIVPAGQRVVLEWVYGTLRQYADKFPLTDVVQDTHECPILNEMTDVCSEQIIDTMERLKIATAKSGTNVFYASTNSSPARTNVDGIITRGLFRMAVRALRKNRAAFISQLIKPSGLIATEPVAPSYFAVAHTDLQGDIEDCEDYLPFEKYASGGAIPFELGKVGSVRICLSEKLDPWLAAATDVSSMSFLSSGAIPSTASVPDVYPIIIFAKGAMGSVRLQGKEAVKPVVLNPGVPSYGNETGQIGSVSWISWACNVILNQLWMARLEVLCTAKH
jgi:N4-gp56 family major capsid protein